jgi:hypothetical protein
MKLVSGGPFLELCLFTSVLPLSPAGALITGGLIGSSTTISVPTREVECTPQLVGTTRKIDLSRVPSDTGTLTASTAAIVVDGVLQAGSLVAGAVIFRSVIQNSTPHGIVVVSSRVGGISPAAFRCGLVQ